MERVKVSLNKSTESNSEKKLKHLRQLYGLPLLPTKLPSLRNCFKNCSKFFCDLLVLFFSKVYTTANEVLVSFLLSYYVFINQKWHLSASSPIVLLYFLEFFYKAYDPLITQNTFMAFIYVY